MDLMITWTYTEFSTGSTIKKVNDDARASDGASSSSLSRRSINTLARRNPSPLFEDPEETPHSPAQVFPDEEVVEEV